MGSEMCIRDRVEQITSEEFHPLSEEILELFVNTKRLTLSEVVDQTGANRNTVKVRMRELVATRHIKQHGKARSTWYSLPLSKELK